MHKQIRATVAKALALTLALSVVGISAPDADAAKKAKKPKLSKNKVTVAVKKKAKIKIKNVKAKKVKKLTVKSTKKSIASVKKNGKTAFTITGKKAGKTTVKANVKIGGKTTKLKVSVKVTAGSKKTEESAAPSASTAASLTPTSTPPAGSQYPGGSTAPSTSQSPAPEQQTEAPSQKPDPTPIPFINDNFDTDLGDWFARFDPAQGNEAHLDLVDEAHSGKAARISGREGADGVAHGWNGPALDLTKTLIPGASYKVTFWAKVPEDALEIKDDMTDEKKKQVKYLKDDGMDLRVSAAYLTPGSEETTYVNYPADTNYHITHEKWTKVEVEFSAPSAVESYIFYLESSTYAFADFIIDDFEMVITSQPGQFDPGLPSIRETYKDYISTMGTAVSYDQLANENILGFVKHHYNSITMGNSMKPDALMGSKSAVSLDAADALVEAGVETAPVYIVSDSYKTFDVNKDADGNVIVPAINFTETDNVMKLASENGLKLRFHTLVWHQQMPEFFFRENYTADGEFITDKAPMLAREEMYIRTVMNHILNSEYADVLYAVDVVNEYTHMSNESEAPNPQNGWKFAFGKEMKTDCEYVKKAFVWAYDELVKAGRTEKVKLYYNDYNTYEPKTTADIIALIGNINTKDDANTVGKICAGVGMQAHFNDASGTVEAFSAALDKFQKAGLDVQITELDVTNTGSTKEATEEEKQKVYKKNAEMYSGIMNVILEHRAGISSVTIWGVTDATSWRPNYAPVLFGTDVSDKKPSFDAVIDAAKNFGK